MATQEAYRPKIERLHRGQTIKARKRQAEIEGEFYQKGVEKAKLDAHKKKPLEEEVREHIGKFIDGLGGQTSAIDVALYGALAYLSYDKFCTVVHHPAETYDYPTQAAKDLDLKPLMAQRDQASKDVLSAQKALDDCARSVEPLGGNIDYYCKTQEDALASAQAAYSNLQKQVAAIANKTVGTDKEAYDTTERYPAAALIGPVALRLATSMGGTPPVAQIAGLAILAALGLCTVDGDILALAQKYIFPTSPSSLGPTASPPLFIPLLM